MTRLASDRARIESEVGIALDETDIAIVERARARGKSHPEIIEEILVHETWFFRDAGVFAALEAHARARGGPLRVLSAPCSTGEEAYACAITLREAGLPASEISVVGIDVSARAIAHAEAGVYAAQSFRAQTPFPSESRWLTGPTGARAVAPELRALVRFRVANLVSEGALEDEAPFDVVLCRNLIVYLTAEARRRLARTISRLLSPSGTLFLGHAEDLAGFERSGPASALMFRTASGVQRAPRPLAPAALAPSPRTARVAIASEVPRRDPPVARPSLSEAQALADAGSLAEAAALTERVLRDMPSADAYVLLGVIESARQRPEAAIAAWQRAVYLQPDHGTAVIALANALRARGQDARADALVSSLSRRGGG